MNASLTWRQRPEMGNPDTSSDRFFKMPHAVFNSSKCRDLPHPAYRLLCAFGLEFNGTNNGRLVMTEEVGKRHGFNGNSTRTKALATLLESGFVIKTKQGHFPKTYSCYGLPWIGVDSFDDLDITPEGWNSEAEAFQETILMGNER